MEIEEAVSVKIESCLKTLPDDFLSKSDQALGNLLLFDKTSKINLKQCIENCCQFIWHDFQKSYNNKLLLSDAYYAGTKYIYSDTYLQMFIELDKFVNPLKDKYSNIEYIEKYVSLLQKMGSPWSIKNITKTHVYIEMDYSDIEPNEKSWLILHWQAIRSLILNYQLHVPARFIELCDLFENKLDLFFLYQVANRMIPTDCVTGHKGFHRISNYNSFISYSVGLTLDQSFIVISKINRIINTSNLRLKLKDQDNCKNFFTKDSTYSQTYTLKEYTKLYKLLTDPQSAESLYSKLRLLKANKLN
jgi:hypothetical protein